MANMKSAEKRARQNDKRRARNRVLKTSAHTAVKKALTQILAAPSRDKALEALKEGEKAIRKTASKGVYSTEKSSRKVSRLALALNKKFPTSSARA